jgi:arylsulfatase A-like enzyme
VGALATVTSTPSLASTAVVAADGSLQSAVPLELSASAPAEPVSTTTTTAPATLPAVKNVVLILADDLDWALFDQIPRLAALKDKGITFTNQTVTDSLCCPSRTSILRGQFLHNHHVISNTYASGGGWPTFRNLGEHRDCLPVWLQSAGVSTALFGKYLNEYPDTAKGARYVPPGWTEWGVPISRADSYTGYDYTINSNGHLRRYGSKPKDFLNDVITTKATDFITRTTGPFFLELSTYNPHNPSPVALRNKGTHVSTVAPRSPNYNVAGTNEPNWISRLAPLSYWKMEHLDRVWRQRAQSAESVADSIDAVMATLEASGKASSTLVVVTSDNGYHVGSHRLSKGKRTAYREDTVVPMIVIGPGVPAGITIDSMTTTVDLAPTFTGLLGAQAPAWVDGRSLTDILATGQAPSTWRTATVSESMGISQPGDPDYQPEAPPPFAALRTPHWLYVVYQDGERELYDLSTDPYEINNIVATADPALLGALDSQLQALRTCAGETCRTADSLPLPAAATS